MLLSKPAVTLEAEAIGRFNVWVEPADEKAGAVPLVPMANVWLLVLKPLSEVMLAAPDAAKVRRVLVLSVK